jgi:hypothetical protein
MIIRHVGECRIVLLLASLAGSVSCAVAGEAADETAKERVDTEFLFGFTAGADVGEVGEREIEHQTDAQWGKRDGNYAALSDQLRFENSPLPNFRFEIGAPIAYYNISGVTGLDDRNQVSFNGLNMEFRYRLFDRDHAPFGLTLGLEPHWNRTDEISGEPVSNYGGELSVALDKELVENRIFAAFNAVYDPEMTQSQGLWTHESMLAFSAAVTTQISPGVFVGGEARYLRKYDGLDLDTLSGQGFFLGPSTFVRLSKSVAISAAWSVQVAGRATDVPGSLDLTKLTRQQAVLRVEYNF